MSLDDMWPEQPAPTKTGNQTILEKAITKAMQRSWDMYDHDKWSFEVIDKPEKTEQHHYFVRCWIADTERFIDAYFILFDPDFAKALWGNTDAVCKICGNTKLELCIKSNIYIGHKSHLMSLWQFRLQQMVIADDPIAYLGQYL